MRVGLNLLYLIPGDVGGTETYAAGLLHGLANLATDEEFVIFVSAEAADWPTPALPNFRKVVCPVPARIRPRRHYFEQMHLPGLLQANRLDLVHSLAYFGPLRPPCPAMVTVHDLHYLRFRNPGLKAFLRGLSLRFLVWQSVQRATRILAVSEFTRREVASHFKVPAERITVTLEAPKVVVPAGKDKTIDLPSSEPYLVAFSSVSPNKNLPRLLEAYQRARTVHGVRQPLVIVGRRPPAGILGEIGAGVSFTGFLDDDTLQTVLAGAYALVFPSYYEGFGLPVLEAMAVGVPVLCSAAASLPEVAGQAALFFDPFSVEDMAQRIGTLCHDPKLRDELRRRGLDQVRGFSWERTAAQTLAIYREIVSAPRSCETTTL